MKYSEFIFPVNDRTHKLSHFDPAGTGKYKSKKDATSDLQKGIKTLSKLQEKLYASDSYSVLIVLQALDAAGKDGTIKHVMSGVNPQGCRVVGFKGPSAEELDHDFLWRCSRQLPRRGEIGIFNRSYYEEVLVVRVHQNMLQAQKIPDLPKQVNKSDFWKDRFDDINNFERHLVRNGTIILKFYLNLSRDEQKNRFLERINDPHKNWKLSINDIKEREYWQEYMHVYQEVFRHTSTPWAPWYIVPADNKWFTRAAICDIIVEKMESLELSFPKLSPEQQEGILRAKELLEKEGDFK